MIARIDQHPILPEIRIVWGEKDDILGYLNGTEFQPTRSRIQVFSRQDLACLLRYLPDDSHKVQGGPAPLHSCPGVLRESQHETMEPGSRPERYLSPGARDISAEALAEMEGFPSADDI